MKIDQFLSTFSMTNATPQVIVLIGSDYPLLFISQLQNRMKQLIGTPIISLSVDNQPEQVKAHLQSSFLGQSSYYWIHDTLSDKWLSYLANYTGPHTVFFYSKTKPSNNKKLQIVELPEAITQDEFTHINKFFYDSNGDFTQRLFTKVQSLTLDQASLLIQYSVLLGKNSDRFFDQWFSEIVIPQTSLFSLSQHFFAKKPRLFLLQWKEICHHYTPQFWIAYFMDQLWRATWYVRFQHTKKNLEAKKIQQRLPFSFLNRDWRYYSINELMAASNALYLIDFHLKNGANDYLLDLFISKFLNNYFRSKSS